MERVPSDLFDIGYALGIGVLLGAERQHREATRRPDRAEDTPIGVRTFALLGLVGWLAGYLAAELPWLPPAVLAFAGLLLAAQHRLYRRSEGAGITTEIAAVFTLGLGMLAGEDRLLAGAVALVATGLLMSKPWVAGIVPKLRRVEIQGTLQLLIAVAIVIPLLPAEPRDPWGALAPRAIGLFVVLIAGVNYVGYFMSRILGKERGVGVAGALGGLTSSTAVTAAMTQTVRRDPDLRRVAQMAVFAANAMSLGRVLVLSVAVSRDVAFALLPPIGAMAAITVAAALVCAPRGGAGASPEGPELKNPFALVPALGWGAVLCAVLLASALASEYLGPEGIVAVAAISGTADVSPITLAAAREAAEGAIATSLAALAVIAAVVANFAVKGGIAALGAGRAFGARVLAVFALASAVGLTLARIM